MEIVTLIVNLLTGGLQAWTSSATPDGAQTNEGDDLIPQPRTP